MADLYQMEVGEQNGTLRFEWKLIEERKAWREAREGTAAAKAASDKINKVMVGFRRTHFFPRPKTPVRRARIGSCLSHRPRSSARARAD